MDAPKNPQPVCAQEALDLLNCTIESPYDKEKCLRLLDSLRQCVINKKVKKFSLAEQNIGKPGGTNEKRS
ncbi:hypothetical protein K7X08_022271 [Anisodus acutangulus]|uniref:CHCH domain-containing protein n=2 Tax=Anisodus TaxID=243963 RepID=A0A9Q1MHN0_9SOLA|nr:hypothetical protein K7X08_022271 [Anisodus acutangulus]KAK4374442.1 hypothetical protein RND71_005119 [Anisodus tanguticus]